MKPRLVMPESVSARLERGRPINAAAEAAPISMRRLVRSKSIFEGILISCCYHYALLKSGKGRARSWPVDDHLDRRRPQPCGRVMLLRTIGQHRQHRLLGEQIDVVARLGNAVRDHDMTVFL